jgi:hypothetical protein
MRYFVTPNFSKKAASLQSEILQSASLALQTIKLSDKSKLMSEGLFGMPPWSLGKDIFVFSSKSQDISIYVTFGNDENGEYLLLLDLTLRRKTPYMNIVSTYKNPKTNAAYNPELNSKINPNWNSSINPRWNSSINPNWNSSINPNWNSSINPNWNSSINPRWNSSINPRWNSSINPDWNSSINPRWNSAYSGPFVYSCDLKQKGFVVRANDSVELIFDLNSSLTSICVKANEKVSVIFDTSNKWIGFLVAANDEVRLRFNLDNEWIGVVV